MVTLRPRGLLKIVGESLTADSVTVPKGTSIVGLTSGATAVMGRAMTFNNAPTGLVTGAVESTSETPPTRCSSTTMSVSSYWVSKLNQSAPANRCTFRLAEQEFLVKRLELTTLGQDYTTASGYFLTPQLPGGITAEGEVKISNGKIYEINVTNRECGYINHLAQPSRVMVREQEQGSSVLKVQTDQQWVLLLLKTQQRQLNSVSRTPST